jgi:hypothetical protein
LKNLSNNSPAYGFEKLGPDGQIIGIFNLLVLIWLKANDGKTEFTR